MHKYKTKPVNIVTTFLGNKTLLQYFRKFNNTTITENTHLLEYQLNDSKVPCFPLSMILIAFNISHTQITKGHSGSEKTFLNFTQNFYFPKAPIWIKVLCIDCIICQLNKPYPNQKQIAKKNKILKDKVYILTIAFHSIQKDQFHHLLKETPELWSLLSHSHIM